MPAKHRSRLRINPKITTPTRFKNLRHHWKTHTMLNSASFLQTKHFHPKDFFRPLELASLDNTSFTDACFYYRIQGIKCPSSELMLKTLKAYPSSLMEIQVNQALRQQFEGLPRQIRRYFKRFGVVILDFHRDPYYGKVNNPYITIGQVKDSTRKAYSYLTADLWTPRGLFTLAVKFRHPGEQVQDLFGDLLAQIELVLSPKLFLMDGEFADVMILRDLIRRGIKFIARKSLTARVKPLAWAYELTDNWFEFRRFHQITLLDKTKKHEVTVHVMFHRVKKKMKALIASPGLDLTVEQTDQTYRSQFGIETGYRDKHKFQGLTTSKSLSVRLILFLFAIVFWNLWQAFVILVFPRKKGSLKRINQWQRQAKPIKRFLTRDEVL